MNTAEPTESQPASAEGLTILVVSRACARFGGTPAHVLDSAIALRRAGASVELAVAQHSPEVDAHHWIHQIPGLDAPTIEGPAERALNQLIARAGPDVIHVHDLYDGRTLRRLASNCALVWSIHNFVGCVSGYWTFPDGTICTRARGPGCFAHELVSNCGLRRIRKLHIKDYWLNGKIMDGLRSADGSVVYSDFVRDHHLINGLPRPEVLPLFVPEIPPPQPLPDTGPVLFAGRLILPKGVMLLLRAVALLDIELVIAGSGYAQAAMEKFVRTHRLADRVRFAGWQSVEGLSALYRRSSSVVFPSILPEGFGLAGIEALAAHRPVVATLRGGMSEWLIPDETGLAVPSLDARDLADALDRLSGDRQLRRELAANGYALVKERFSADRFVLEASRMYRSLLATREPKGRQRIASGAAPHLDA